MKIFLALSACILFIGGCGDLKPPAFTFEVFTTKETIPDVISLVERFSLKEGLHQLKDGNAPIVGSRVNIHFNDGPEISKFIVVSNGNLNNKDHVEISIFILPHVKGCDICKRLEDSDEMKEIKQKFEIKNFVKNGKW